MKNKIIYMIMLVCFIVTLALNYFYGSFLYSKIIGKEESYIIGQLCDSNRKLCEEKYFKNYLDDIENISNKPRTFFSNIIIQKNQVDYVGNCPCPYNSDSRGYSCGYRSSYSKNGQVSYCYDNDISEGQIVEVKTSMQKNKQRDLQDAVDQKLNVYHEKYTLIIIIIVYSLLWFSLKKKIV